MSAHVYLYVHASDIGKYTKQITIRVLIWLFQNTHTIQWRDQTTMVHWSWRVWFYNMYRQIFYIEFSCWDCGRRLIYLQLKKKYYTTITWRVFWRLRDYGKSVAPEASPIPTSANLEPSELTPSTVHKTTKHARQWARIVILIDTPLTAFVEPLPTTTLASHHRRQQNFQHKLFSNTFIHFQKSYERGNRHIHVNFFLCITSIFSVLLHYLWDWKFALKILS